VGRIEWVNEGFGRMNGYILKEVKGTCGEILRKGKPLKASDQDRMEESKRTRKTFGYETINYKKNGEKYWVQTSVTPVFNKRNEFIYFIIIETDITERVKFASELQKAKQTAEKAKQSEERFLANMSHEIRTPLNAISGMAEMLYKTKLNQSQYNYVNTISASSGILVSIIGDILDISQIKSSKIEFEEVSFSAYGLIFDMIDISKPDLKGKSIELKTEIDSEFSNNIIGDPLRLKQIFLNLVSNAAKFTNNGTITISAKVLKQDKTSIDAKFSVTDTGIGIAEENLAVIFDSFQQAQSSTKRKYGGTGLGLAIVKSLVQLQGGNIYVESEESKGTSFTFTLGFKKDNTKFEQQETNSETVTSLKGIKFLLVEDNDMNQFYVQELFREKWDVEIDCANDGEVAIDKVTKKDYDIILMDVQMPNMDGFQATRYIRKEMPASKSQVPILGITANASIQDRKNCIAAGMNDYLTKPIKEKELFSKICILLSVNKARSN
jgi:PAS domain S-box-containing protein